MSSREGDIKLIEEEIKGTRGIGQKVVQAWQTYNGTCQKEITALLKKAGIYDQVAAIEGRRGKRRAEAEAQLAPINAKLSQLYGTLAFLNQRDAEEKATPITKAVSLDDAPPPHSAPADGIGPTDDLTSSPEPIDAPEPPAV